MRHAYWGQEFGQGEVNDFARGCGMEYQTYTREEELLDAVGLAARRRHYLPQMSGGEQQRVAIARAVVTDPTILVADEPTGDLDRASAKEIMSLMCRLSRESGKTIIMVTHDPKAAEAAQVIRHLDKGYLNNAHT